MKKKILTRDGFDIYFEALPDTIDKSDFDVNFEEIVQDIESGELVLFCAKVTSERAGIEINSDYLGKCIYKSEEEFYTTKGDYFDQMVNEVLKDSPRLLNELIESLKM